MKKNEVEIGGRYIAKVSGKLAEVRITGENRHGGWDAVNVTTNKTVRIKSAQRLRAAAGKPKAKAEPKVDEPAQPAVSSNPLANATGSEFAEALNKATAEQLSDALNLQCWSTRQRSRIEATLKTRRATPPADDVAKTVDAVTKGDLAKGVEVPMPARTRKAREPQTDDLAVEVDAAAAEGRKRASGLDAAVQVLAEAGRPLTTGEMVDAMLAKGLWKTDGKTPAATIYSAILREMKVKGSQARFRKTERGHFELTDTANRS